MAEYVDLGQLITELEIQRDDALANLRLEQARSRYLERKLDSLRETAARVNADLYEAVREAFYG